MTNRRRLMDILIPFIVVGASALPARLLTTGNEASAPQYLVPLALAVLTGLWRPNLLGSVGSWLGWSVGVALGWLIDSGDFWLSGPLAYGFLVAFVPHVIGSRIRILLRPTAEVAPE